MANVFAILLLVSLGFLVWGLISPKSLSKNRAKPLNRKQAGLGFGIIAIVFFILFGVTYKPTANQTQAIKITTTKSKAAVSPAITYKTVTQTKAIPFTSSTVQDASLAQGTTKVTTAGVNGIETITYQDTYTNGKLTTQKQVSDAVTTKPINQVTSIGTYVAPATSSATPTQTQTSPSTSTPASTPSCYPLSDEGGCYEAGEYCRESDEGTSGVAGNGEAITCENNNGLRWEPS